MRVFVIHRSKERRIAQSKLTALSKRYGFHLQLTMLKKSYGDKWQDHASNEIEKSEIVIHFRGDESENSTNVEWELKRSAELEKSIVCINSIEDNPDEIAKIRSAVEFDDEFESCFKAVSKSDSQTFELYKLMVATSEELIRRRQITNGFFITIIGALVTIAGLLIGSESFETSSSWVLIPLTLVAMLLCRSWSNLIDNYGKLNKGKFRVIGRLEKELPARIFDAEWNALGKGLRPEKYRSFTNTEQNVPKIFFAGLGLLLVVLWALWIYFQVLPQILKLMNNGIWV